MPPQNLTEQQISGEHERDMKLIEAGFLGKFFGYGENVIKNVGGLVLVILTIIILISYFRSPLDDWSNILKNLSPFITLILGYLVGENKSGNN